MKLDLEDTYTQCKNIIKDETKDKLMGWLYRVLLQKSIDDGLFFFEKKTGVIIGFAVCRLLVKSGVISIDKIGIHPTYRHCGLGTKLLNRIKKLGLPVKLDVVAKNTIAVKFYRKNGFKRVGSKKLGEDINVLVMMFTPTPTPRK